MQLRLVLQADFSLAPLRVGRVRLSEYVPESVSGLNKAGRFY
jgi:hypothetical protein